MTVKLTKMDHEFGRALFILQQILSNDPFTTHFINMLTFSELPRNIRLC